LIYEGIPGVPRFEYETYAGKSTPYCLLIPVINEGGRVLAELLRAQEKGIDRICDIIICDGGSTDGSMESDVLRRLGISARLTKLSEGKQGAQLRMGFWWALQQGYKGFVTIDGNNKDSIEDIPHFFEKLDEGCDFVQGSRFIKGGRAINTPISRYLAVRFLHAPLISLTARFPFTDTTNAFRAYSRRYLEHPKTIPLRDIFVSYELLAYLSVRASQLGLKVCEIPVTRAYPKHEKTPTKISPWQGNRELLRILFATMRGEYSPKGEEI
jgi:dolichol-phosphate mannosyltransferase